MRDPQGEFEEISLSDSVTGPSQIQQCSPSIVDKTLTKNPYINMVVFIGGSTVSIWIGSERGDTRSNPRSNDPPSLHEKALGLAKQYKAAQAKLLSVLQQIDSMKAFRDWGFASLWDYCVSGLKLSESESESLIRVARKSVEIPQLKKAVEEGVVTLSSARKVCAVITAQSQEVWLGKAASLTQRELEREIAKENPATHVSDRVKPVAVNLSELRCGVSDEVEGLVRRVQDVISQQRGTACSLAEALKEMAELFLEKKDPVRKAERVLRKKKARETDQVGSDAEGCCKKGVGGQTRGSNSRESSNAALPGARRIPAKVRHAISLRDQGQCTFVGSGGRRCGQRRWVEAHHLRPRSLGGGHTIDNLTTLCGAHHRAVHHRALHRAGPGPSMTGRAISVKPS